MVDQGRLHRQPHRVVQGQLHHREANLDPVRTGSHRPGKHQRVGIGYRSIEMMFRQPDRVQADFLRPDRILQSTEYKLVVLLPRWADGKYHTAEPHQIAAPPLRCWAKKFSVLAQEASEASLR